MIVDVLGPKHKLWHGFEFLDSGFNSKQTTATAMYG